MGGDGLQNVWELVGIDVKDVGKGLKLDPRPWSQDHTTDSMSDKGIWILDSASGGRGLRQNNNILQRLGASSNWTAMRDGSASCPSSGNWHSTCARAERTSTSITGGRRAAQCCWGCNCSLARWVGWGSRRSNGHDVIIERDVRRPSRLERYRMGAEMFEHVEYCLEPQVLYPTLAFWIQRHTQVL